MLTQNQTQQPRSHLYCENKNQIIQIANQLKKDCGIDSYMFFYNNNMDSAQLYKSNQQVNLQEVLQKQIQNIDPSILPCN